MDGGLAYLTAAPPPPSSYLERLAVLRRQGIDGVGNLSWCSLVFLFPIILGMIHQVCTFFLIGLMESSKVDPGVVMGFYVLGLIVASIGLSIGAMVLVRIWFRNVFRGWHAEIWQELHYTNLAVMVVDDSYTSLIVARLQDTYGLGWLSPPPPRRLEDQLEFAACYHLALRKLLWGVGRVDNNPLWQGSVANYASTTRGITCGCFSLMFLGIIGTAIWILGSVLYLKRCAALAAYCDFLLKDE